MSDPPLAPPSTLSKSISSLAEYKKDVLIYVKRATTLPLNGDEYRDDLRTKVPVQFESHVERILDVYQKMRDHCIHYEDETHPVIVDSVSSIAEYSSGAEGVYLAICSIIVEMGHTNSQEGSGDLIPLIDDNIEKITKFIRNSQDANDKLNDFRKETWFDFNAADRETKNLDAELLAYEGNITKESDLIEDTKRVIDKTSNTFILHSFLSKPMTWRKAKASRFKLDLLLDIKKNGDAMKEHLQGIRNLADSAGMAMEALIGAFEDVSKQLKEIKEIVNTDLRNAIVIAVQIDKSKILKRWKSVGDLARDFLADAYRPGENLGKNV